MVSKTDLQKIGFDNMDTYYQEIVTAQLSGKKLYCETLINQLSSEQKKEFVNKILMAQNDPEGIFKMTIHVITTI